MTVVIILIIAYLLGSLPTGYWTTKYFLRTDIRKHGSGNIGATNVLRVGGWKAALPVLLFDALKGFLAVMLAKWLIGVPAVFLAAGFLVMLGHCFPLFLKFKGGKAAATGIGVLCALSLWALVIIVGSALIVIAVTRYVSLGSIVGAALTPFVFLALGYGLPYFVFGLAMAALVIYRHRQNIERLRSGTEAKFGGKA